VAYAAFVKEKNYFEEANLEYVPDPVNFDLPHLLRGQLFDTWGPKLDITEDENNWACDQAWEAMRLYDDEMQRRGLELLTAAERDNDIVLLMLARPYHEDPGLNHLIMEEFQALGYPVISTKAIPKDPIYLKRFFQDDLDSGLISDVFDLRDIWPENYSVNSVQKVWAAKFAARHPNVGVVDLSSFKCGHDAPTYGLIDSVISATKTPYLALHDLDANKPTGSIKIRVKTFAYTLELYKDTLAEAAAKSSQLEIAVAGKRAELAAVYQTELERNIEDSSGEAKRGLQEAFEAYLNRDESELERESFEAFLNEGKTETETVREQKDEESKRHVA
jgi:predicted nucleotide-binding protein (sugar kinase/HSP70/actin superfamily)